MAPNLLGKNSSLILTGTPPKTKDCFYYNFKGELMERIKRRDDRIAYFEFPTSVNPIIDPVELEITYQSLLASDDLPIWKREYLGQDCFSGRDSVFPKFDTEVHCRPLEYLESIYERDKSKLKWITIADPGTVTCFAVLFLAYNPFTSQVFCLDEIYETDRRHNDSHQIWERIKKKEKALWNGDWIRVYDEAGAWFANEVKNNFRQDRPNWRPTRKRKDKIEDQISMIKVSMGREGCFWVAKDKCPKLIWEIENYVTDEEGNLPEDNDHLLDDLRYGYSSLNIKMVEGDNKVENGRLITLPTPNSEYGSSHVKIQRVDENWSQKALQDFDSGEDSLVSWDEW